MTRYVLEFGVLGGAHVDNAVIPTAVLAVKLAAGMVAVLSEQGHSAPSAAHGAWKPVTHPDCARLEWQSDTHFVSLSRLPNELGAASGGFWRIAP